MKHYILVDRKPVPVGLMEWACAMEACAVDESSSWCVGGTTIGDVRVSTVFLGLDHQCGNGPPLLFETMAFGLSGDEEWQERCSTWEQAEAMHEAMCARVRAAE